MAQRDIMIGDRPATSFTSSGEAGAYMGRYLEKSAPDVRGASDLAKKMGKEKGRDLFASFLAAEGRRGARMQELRGQTGMRATMAQRRAFFEEPDSGMRRTTGAV